MKLALLSLALLVFYLAVFVDEGSCDVVATAPSSQVQPGSYYGSGYYGGARPYYRRRRRRRNYGLLGGLFDLFVGSRRRRRGYRGWDRDRDWDSGSRGYDSSGYDNSYYSDDW